MMQAGVSAADWAGWFAGVSGIAGSLLLVRPLFILLRHREAIEILEHAATMQALSEDLKREADIAKRILAKTAYKNRHRWKPWAYCGLAALAFGLLAVLAQGLMLALD